MHILPLALIEIQSPAIKRARLIKNANLETVIELFDGRQTGSGQIELPGLTREMGWSVSPPHPDLALLRKLVLLPSFDVYSLRILLRDNDIPIKDGTVLSLSPAKMRELTSYMMSFTRPLLKEIFQDEDAKVATFADLVELFRNPDVKKVQERLHRMSQVLGIEVREIPKFLEDYGDTFLSLSYYRRCLDEIVPTIGDFLESLRSFKGSHQLASDAQLMRTCAYMEETINALLTSTTGRLENFERSTNDLWQNLSADSFRKVEELIKGYQVVIGGILCAMSVKMYAWAKLFPKKGKGSLVRRAEFVMSDMRLGLNRIQKLEDSTPILSNLSSPAAGGAMAATG